MEENTRQSYGSIGGNRGGENTRQRGLFHDPEVGTEAHDDVVAWLASEAGRMTVAKGLFRGPLVAVQPMEHRAYSVYSFRPQWNEEWHARWWHWFPNASDQYELAYRVRDLKALPQLEVLYQSRTGYIIGFADLVVDIEITYQLERDADGCAAYLEHAAHLRDALVVKRRKILVEVKTGKLKLGEVLRQMNTYAEMQKDITDKLLVVKQMPPAHYVEALASQGVSVGYLSGNHLEWLHMSASVA